MTDIECCLPAQASLGECPRWSVPEQRLYWVNIAERELHCFDPGSGRDKVRQFGQPVGCFALRRQGGFVLAQQDRFALIDDFDAPERAIPVVLAAPENRFNDGRCDRSGRFWAGTVDALKQQGNGGLYRLDQDLSVRRLADGVMTANGLAFSPDDRVLYWSDTPRHVVYAYDFDLASGSIADQRVFARFPAGGGRPDGAAVDEQGCYWSALYDGGRVVRFSPAGEILSEVKLPVRHCTMIAFGGADLRTAYVTTARQGMTAEELERWPDSGGVFRFHVDVPGLPEPEFAG